MPIDDLPPGSKVTPGVDVQLRKAYHELELIVRDIEQSYWGGSRRDNGDRSRIRKLSRAIKYWIKKARNYEDVKQRLETHLKEHDTMSAREVAIEVARINAEATKHQSKWKEIAAIVVACLMLGGQFLQNYQTAQINRELLGKTTTTQVSK